MKLSRIKSKYCTKDKVQIISPISSKQIICSKDGYLYLRYGDKVIHRYLDDEIREKMPYKDIPSSKIHANHLLKYDQIYVEFKKDMEKAKEFLLYHSLRFLYVTKNSKNETICAELELSDFESEEKTFENFTRKDVENFLYNANGLPCKCIFDWTYGIVYAKSIKEQECIYKDYIDLTDENIIKMYNEEKHPHPTMFFSVKHREEYEKEVVKCLDDVEEFSLTKCKEYEFSTIRKPILLVIKESQICVYEFEIIYCSKDCFKIKSIKHKICMNDELIRTIKSNTSAPYLGKPKFKKYIKRKW